MTPLSFKNLYVVERGRSIRWASSLPVQRVDSIGSLYKGNDSTSWTLSPCIVRLRPVRGASCNIPSSPKISNRRTIFHTVLRLTLRYSATSFFFFYH
jgi:hypothetical protein